MRIWMPLLCVAWLAAAGCSVKKDASAQNDEAANAANDMTPEGPSLTTKLFGGGKPMALDVQHKFANGAIIYLTSVQAKPTETVVGVRIVNGAERDIMLNWSNHNNFLVAGGQKFFLSPPLENKDVKVTQGSKLEGDLVYLGTLPQSGPVTLVINDGQTDSEYNNTPGASIPIPVTSAAYSDDGSKKTEFGPVRG